MAFNGAGTSGAAGAQRGAAAQPAPDTAEELAELDREWAEVRVITASQQEALDAPTTGDTFEESPAYESLLHLPPTETQRQQEGAQTEPPEQQQHNRHQLEQAPPESERAVAVQGVPPAAEAPLQTQPEEARQPALFEAEDSDDNSDFSDAVEELARPRSMSRSPDLRGPGLALPEETPVRERQRQFTPASRGSDEPERWRAVPSQARASEDGRSDMFLTQRPATQAPVGSQADPMAQATQQPTPMLMTQAPQVPPATDPQQPAQEPTQATPVLATQAPRRSSGAPALTNEAALPGAAEKEEEGGAPRRGFVVDTPASEAPPIKVTLPASIPETQQDAFGDGGGGGEDQGTAQQQQEEEEQREQQQQPQQQDQSTESGEQDAELRERVHRSVPPKKRIRSGAGAVPTPTGAQPASEVPSAAARAPERGGGAGPSDPPAKQRKVAVPTTAVPPSAAAKGKAQVRDKEAMPAVVSGRKAAPKNKKKASGKSRVPAKAPSAHELRMKRAADRALELALRRIQEQAGIPATQETQ